jgi:hypothetical protein
MAHKICPGFGVLTLRLFHSGIFHACFFMPSRGYDFHSERSKAKMKFRCASASEMPCFFLLKVMV